MNRLYAHIRNAVIKQQNPEHILVCSGSICVIIKPKCAAEKGSVRAKKCRDSGQNDDLCADYQVL